MNSEVLETYTMKSEEEIKEILDRLFVYKNENDEMKYQPEDILTINDVWLLLDYITNLREENEKVHKELDYADNYNIYLISKIDKAIEYIEKCRDYHKTYHKDGYLYPDEITSLLMILKGDNK